jgi:7,8-dihydroneopterin aldolase/epimerase/oxygenase
MDRVRIHELRVPVLLGVRDWERHVRQVVVIDLELGLDTSRAAAEDRLELAVDYGAVARRVREHAESKHTKLIETLADQIAVLILREFRASTVRVRITKPRVIPDAGGASVEIERTRTST